jgi:hypothetical protein
VKFLIDTLDGETIETAIWNVGVVFHDDDVLYVRGVPCKLSTARSMESDAVKEAAALIRRLDSNSNIGWGLLEELNAWLEKWGDK